MARLPDIVTTFGSSQPSYSLLPIASPRAASYTESNARIWGKATFGKTEANLFRGCEDAYSWTDSTQGHCSNMRQAQTPSEVRRLQRR